VKRKQATVDRLKQEGEGRPAWKRKKGLIANARMRKRDQGASENKEEGRTALETKRQVLVRKN